MPIPTQRQVSAGGVVFRRTPDGPEIVLIAVGDQRRWQLPKGLVDAGESTEMTALRETWEEAGVDAELIAPLETIEYWYYGTAPNGRVRYHKFVHFYLLEYTSGDVRNHDKEVHEARWVPITDAIVLLAFASERRVVRETRQLLAE